MREYARLRGRFTAAVRSRGTTCVRGSGAQWYACKYRRQCGSAVKFSHGARPYAAQQQYSSRHLQSAHVLPDEEVTAQPRRAQPGEVQQRHAHAQVPRVYNERQQAARTHACQPHAVHAPRAKGAAVRHGERGAAQAAKICGRQQAAAQKRHLRRQERCAASPLLSTQAWYRAAGQVRGTAFQRARAIRRT